MAENLYIPHHKMAFKARGGGPILVLFAATWGELGNFTAAHRLTTALKAELPGSTVVMQEFEEWCPRFAAAGAAMKKLAEESSYPAMRESGYMKLMLELEYDYPPDFELSRVEIADLLTIGNRLRESGAALVIATKGLISRIICAARDRYLPNGPAIINYVTNDGLLTLPIHRSRAPDMHIVQGEYGLELLKYYGLDTCAIRLTGRLIAKAEMLAFDLDDRPFVAVFANRGDAAYEGIFDKLAQKRDAVRVWGICVESPKLLRFADRVKRPHWTLSGALKHSEYLSALGTVRAARRSIMICKAGPNTVFESLGAEVPILALRSGLPMEDWVSAILNREQLFGAFDSMDALCGRLEYLLDHPHEIDAGRARARAYAAQKLDTRSAVIRLSAAVREMLPVPSARDENGELQR